MTASSDSGRFFLVLLCVLSTHGGGLAWLARNAERAQPPIPIEPLLVTLITPPAPLPAAPEAIAPALPDPILPEPVPEPVAQAVIPEPVIPELAETEPGIPEPVEPKPIEPEPVADLPPPPPEKIEKPRKVTKIQHAKKAKPVKPAPEAIQEPLPEPLPEPEIAVAGPEPVVAASPVLAPAPIPAQPLQPSVDNEPATPPVFNADYLRNPAPPYPRLSRRLGEQGKVMLRVLVNTGGGADKIEIQKSSGSTRLDQAALQAVTDWRFVPAKHGEKPIAEWVVVPIVFSLEG